MPKKAQSRRPLPAKGIFCFWHRCTLPCGWYFRNFRCSILISQSFDGELIARTLGLLGYNSVRGSSSRGGAAGLLALQDVLESGLPVVFTADGPRGPIYQTKIGPVKLAQMTGESMGSFYLLPERAWVLKSWDQFLIPKAVFPRSRQLGTTCPCSIKRMQMRKRSKLRDWN